MAIGGRVWALLILAVSTPVLGDAATVLWLAGIGLLWLVATAADVVRPMTTLGTLAEAMLVGIIAGVTVDDALAVFVPLAIPPFTAALRRGVRGLLRSLSAELVTFVVVALAITGSLETRQAGEALTWALTGVGLGLIASYVHADLYRPRDPLAPYRDAQRLIRELLDLSGDLRSGLDPVALGSRIAVEVRNALPVVAVAVHVPRGDDLTPLVASAGSSGVDESLTEPVAHQARTRRTIRVEDRLFAFPLLNDGRTIAVVSGMMPARTDPSSLGLADRLGPVVAGLAPLAVQLDTALLFRRLRDTATSDERRRLARDLHDGVAQDIASLGYLVDALAAAPATPGQAEGLRRLRERITSVVAEVRRSVHTLRTDAESAESLGAAISGLARHLSESSGIPIRVTVNERTTRLRPEVEAELMRIAQEAMTNAVRHARASVIDVSCKVAAPTAEITVRDDGDGLGNGRSDSYGLAIMRERAELVDADLSVQSAEPRGTVVTVTVPSRRPSGPRTRDDRPDRVSA